MKSYSFCKWIQCLMLLFFIQYASSSFAQSKDVIEEVYAVETRNGLQITLELTSSIPEEYRGIVVRYLPKKKLSDKSRPKWIFSTPYLLENNAIVFNEFDIEQYYFFTLGLIDLSKPYDEDEIIAWSEVQFFEHDSSWSIGAGLTVQLLALLGALGLFIFGMKTMSEGIQKGTGKMLRKMIGGMTSNRANGIFYGFLTTSIVQSSSATTVMVVSFVNNGLLNLKQSIAVIMGANVGTTVTAWLIALLGFKSFMPDYALIIFLVAIIFVFSAKAKLRPWGEVLTGIALLFFGLEFFKLGIPDTRNTIDQFEFLNTISGTSFWNVILATLVGAVITIVFQSSIAALVIIILLCARGIIPYEMGLGMVLGSNIGTTITANIAALVGNVHAKRAARAHLVFNLFGVIWMVFSFPYFMQFLNWIITDIFQMADPMSYQGSRPVGLALFHSLFNIVNATVLYFFINAIATLVVRLVPTRSDDDEVFQLGYIQAGMLSTPELTIIEAKKEVARFGKLTSRMSEFFQKLLIETDKKKKKYLYDKIEKYEDITDRVEVEITNYLTQVSENDLSDETSKKVRSMMSVANYMERIGDVFYQMSITLQRKEEEKIWFSPEQRQNLQKMLRLLDEAFEIMVQNLNASSEKVSLIRALEIEEKIDAWRDKLRVQHFENVERQEYNIKSGIVYSDLFYSCEKIGDHIMSISESLLEESAVDSALEVRRLEKLKNS